MEGETQKLTVNRLLDLIENLPVEKRNSEKVQKIKYKLQEIKFNEENKGFGGLIVLHNTEELIQLMND